MKSQQLFLKVQHVSIFVLFFSVAFVSTSSALTTDSSGLCCANNILKETTEKQCSKAKGKFYSAKEKTIAQKECRSPKPVVPGMTSVTGFCCRNGVVQKASQAQCSKLKGSYYISSALAKKSCKPKNIFCCVDGKISERSPGECKKRKGTAYASAAEAKKKCKPADIYCCADGKIKKTSPQQCKQYRGTAYKTVTEAKRKCKAADIYCCIAGKNIKTSAKQCAQRKGTAYKTISEANKKCNSQAVYCCIDGEISRLSSKQCRSKRGKEYITQLIAQKSCAKQITGFNRAGNTARRSITSATAKAPDLIVQDTQLVNSSKSATPTIQLTIKNIGTATAPKNDIHLATTGIQNKKKLSPLSTELSCPSLRPGQSTVLTWPIKAKETSQVTSYALSVQVDTGNVVLEKNEKNNRLSQTLTLSPSFQQRETAGNASPSQVSARGISSVVGSIQNQTVTDTRLLDTRPLDAPTMPNWTTVSGDVSNQERTSTIYFVEHVSAQRIGSPSPASNIQNVISPMTNNKSYSLNLPPNSTWLIQPVISRPLNFKEIRPFSITTSAEGESITRHIVVEIDDRAQAYNEAWEWCYFSGAVTFSGQIPTENVFIRLTPQGDGLPASNWPLTPNGTFSFHVPPGQYKLQPHSMANTAYDNTIAAQEYICPANYPDEIIANFDYAPPELCVLSGHVVNNGLRDAEIRSLTLRTADGSVEPLTIPVTPSGDYRIELPTGKSYTIIPVVPEHWQAPSRYAFRISPTDSEKTINVEVFQPEFQLGDLTDMDIEENPGNMAPSVKISFQTLLIGGDKEKYDRTVRITSPAKPGWSVTSNCAFKTDGSCMMSVWLDGFDVQNDSLHAQIVGLEGMPNSSRDYPLPFSNVPGDLTLHHGGVLTIDRAQNSATFHFEVKNIGPAASSRCYTRIKVNQREAVSVAIPSLSVGERHRIDKHIATNIDAGDEIVLQIDDACDNFPENNQLSLVIEDHDAVDHRDHVPVEEEDNTEHVRMTGEAESFWDWFDW